MIDAKPRQFVAIRRGVRFGVELPDGDAQGGGIRGHICENYGGNFRLPDLEPIGSS